MVGIGDLFGEGTIGQQFLVYGVLQQLFGAAMNPALLDIAQAVNSADPVATLTPEQLAAGVVRQILDGGNSESEAAKSGIGPGRFEQLQLLAAQPPALGLLLQAAQRSLGLVGPGMDAGVDLDAALADLGISSQYRPLVKAQLYQSPTADQVYLAWLQGQITEDEARSRIAATGLDPSWITSGYNAQGQAPTPNELLDLWNRGIIAESGTGPDSTSYDQGFLEGPWRNKWLEAFKALRLYIPPPRTTQAMLREGTITEAQATIWLNSYGVFGDTLAAFLDGTHKTTSVAQRTLTQAQVLDLYESKLATKDEALADLVALKYSAQDATLLLELADLKAATASTKSAITRLKNLYLAGTNTATQTRAALTALGLTDANVVNLVTTWNLEQSAQVRTLTAAEIAGAFFYNILTQPTATARLVAMGYSSSDAEIVLAVRQHALLPGQVIA